MLAAQLAWLGNNNILTPLWATPRKNPRNNEKTTKDVRWVLIHEHTTRPDPSSKSRYDKWENAARERGTSDWLVPTRSARSQWNPTRPPTHQGGGGGSSKQGGGVSASGYDDDNDPHTLYPWNQQSHAAVCIHSTHQLCHLSTSPSSLLLFLSLPPSLPPSH